MKTFGENVRFDYRFDGGGGVKLCATRDRMPERTFELHVENDGPQRHFSCGFIEFVEIAESAGSVLSRVMDKLHDTMPSFPSDFPEVLFQDTLGHWLLFNFGTPIRRVTAAADEAAAPEAGAAAPIARS